MAFTFRLSASRSRPLAPSIHIGEDGQIQLTLSRYTPQKGPVTDYFDSALYEGLKAQYQKLGLREVEQSDRTRTWRGPYTEDARRYVLSLTRGKATPPPVLTQETITIYARHSKPIFENINRKYWITQRATRYSTPN